MASSDFSGLATAAPASHFCGLHSIWYIPDSKGQTQCLQCLESKKVRVMVRTIHSTNPYREEFKSFDIIAPDLHDKIQYGCSNVVGVEAL